MDYLKQRVLDVALGEVGYLEKDDALSLDLKTEGAGRSNYTKYSRDLAAVNYFNGRKQGVEWCAVFVAWCFFRAYGKEGALRLLNQPVVAAQNAGAGCRHAMNYFKAKGRFYSDDPQAGDVVFFYSPDMGSIAHTGIVYRVEGDRLYTVEGNTSGPGGVNSGGGGVFRKEYRLPLRRIVGYGRPDYSDAGGQNNEQNAGMAAYDTYTVKKGDTLWGIAKKLLGNGRKYTLLKSENGIVSDVIRPGQELKIPKNG